MKISASEFLESAERISSNEMNLKKQVERVKSREADICKDIIFLESSENNLRERIKSLTESASSSEGSSDNSAIISALWSEVSQIRDRIKEEEKELEYLSREKDDLCEKLAQVQTEKREVLNDIQDSSNRINQNIAQLSSVTGVYADVASRATGSFQKNIDQLDDAARLLGGKVVVDKSIPSGSIIDRGEKQVARKNFYEEASRQRNVSARTTSGSSGRNMFGRVIGGGKNIRFTKYLSRQTSDGARDVYTKKKTNHLKQNIKNTLNLPGAMKDFSGCTVVKRAGKQDFWDILGSGYESYLNYRSNPDKYVHLQYDSYVFQNVEADNIEGISNIRTADVVNPDIFWGRDSGKTMQTFMDIAKFVPEVQEQLNQGKSLDEIVMDERLGECATIYFANAPKVYKGDGYYEFYGNGRHRILAARALNLSIPVFVVGEIHEKEEIHQDAIETTREIYDRIVADIDSANDRQYVIAGSLHRKMKTPHETVGGKIKGKWTSGGFVLNDEFVPPNCNPAHLTFAEIKKRLWDDFGIDASGPIPYPKNVADFSNISIAHVSTADIVCKTKNITHKKYDEMKPVERARLFKEVFGDDKEDKRKQNFETACQIVADRQMYIPGLGSDYTKVELLNYIQDERHQFTWDEQVHGGYNLVPTIIHQNLSHTGLVSIATNIVSNLEQRKNDLENHPEKYSWSEKDPLPTVSDFLKEDEE